MKNDHEAAIGSDVAKILVENHRRFQAFLQPRVRSVEDADEILQAAFMRAAEKADSIRDEERVVAWFYRLLRNAIIDYYRRKNAEQKAIEKLSQLAIDEAVADPELERVVCECIHDLIPTLKPEYADVLKQVDLEGVSIPEAANAMGISSNNAHVRLHRARAALHERLVQTCGTCTTHGCLDCTCKSC
jgi:RNA polymerase sigma factor (sigma-70 family)